MDYRIVDKPAFRVVGKALRVSTKDGENLRRIPEFWDKCIQDGLHDQLETLSSQNVLPDVMLGVCTDFTSDMSEFTYLIAAESESGTVPESLTAINIPAATWAVFETSGPLPEAIQNVWGHIWSEFFPSAPYKHGDGPELELYPSGDPAQPDYQSEVWVPVVGK